MMKEDFNDLETIKLNSAGSSGFSNLINQANSPNIFQIPYANDFNQYSKLEMDRIHLNQQKGHELP